MAGQLMIEAHGLTKRYGETQALAGVDFAVRPGPSSGVLGPNGAGKTTAVRILTTLATPDSGRATVAGLRRVTEAGRSPPPHRRGGAGRHPRRAPHRAPEPGPGRRAEPDGPLGLEGAGGRAARTGSS